MRHFFSFSQAMVGKAAEACPTLLSPGSAPLSELRELAETKAAARLPPDFAKNLVAATLGVELTNKVTFCITNSIADPWHFGTDPDSHPDPRISAYFFLTLHLYHFFKDKKVKKKSQNSGNQGFSYYFCLMIEESGSESRRPKNLRIRIRNTDQNKGYRKFIILFRGTKKISSFGSLNWIYYKKKHLLWSWNISFSDEMLVFEVKRKLDLLVVRSFLEC